MALTGTGTQLPWHSPGAAEEDRCCCGAACCMFPAPEPPEDLEATDVPSAVTINGISVDFDSGSMAYAGEGFPAAGPWNETSRVLRAVAGGWWELGTPLGHVIARNRCLITGDGRYVEGDDTVEDQFEAQYVVRIDALAYYGLWNGETSMDVVVTRQSLCEWRGKIFSPCSRNTYFNAVALGAGHDVDLILRYQNGVFIFDIGDDCQSLDQWIDSGARIVDPLMYADITNDAILWNVAVEFLDNGYAEEGQWTDSFRAHWRYLPNVSTICCGVDLIELPVAWPGDDWFAVNTICAYSTCDFLLSFSVTTI